ncbi:MAG TPA: SPOR domain-containing protein, partial [Burkholderiaceae bacterium]
MSFFKRGESKGPAAKPVSGSVDHVQQLRLRARRRLIGAALLVGVGVIGFPLVFETQPRPIPVDLPIDIPRKEGAPPLAIPQTNAPAASQALVEEVAAVVPPEAAVASQPESVQDKPVEKPVNKPAPVKVSEPARVESARAQALLEGKPTAKTSEPATGRFVVQVGAYADSKAAHEAR